VVSVHFADVGPSAGLRLLLKRAPLASVSGLRHADLGVAIPLSTSVLPAPGLRRVGLLGFWEDDDALSAFEDDHPLAARLSGGWSARLEPLRRFGSWPGLSEDITTSRHTDHDGSAVVLTLGRLRLTQAVRFLRASARAQTAVLAARGTLWGTALARPPFVATCSIWDSSRSIASYAYGAGDQGHPDAIKADAAKPFHQRSAFVRLRPYRVDGSLDGTNPLAAELLSAST
jgi:hypothetical protein